MQNLNQISELVCVEVLWPIKLYTADCVYADPWISHEKIQRQKRIFDRLNDTQWYQRNLRMLMHTRYDQLSL